MLELFERIVNEGNTISHPGAEIPSRLTKNHHDAASHVFASVIACAFDDRRRAAIPDGKTLACSPGGEQTPASSAVENRVAHNHVFV